MTLALSLLPPCPHSHPNTPHSVWNLLFSSHGQHFLCYLGRIVWIIIAGNQRCFSTAGTVSFWCCSVTLSRQKVGHGRGRILGFVVFSNNSLLEQGAGLVRPLAWPSLLGSAPKGHLGPTWGNRNLQGLFSTVWALRKNHLTCSHSSQISMHQSFIFLLSNPPTLLKTDGTTQLHFIQFSYFTWWQLSHHITARKIITKKI